MFENRDPGAPTIDPRRIAVVASGAESLLATLPVAAGRARTRQIMKAKGVRILRLSFDAGQVLRDHVESVPVLIQTLQGSVTLSVAGAEIAMPAGAIVHIDGKLAHSIVAAEASHLMMTLLGPHRTKPRVPSPSLAQLIERGSMQQAVGRQR